MWEVMLTLQSLEDEEREKIERFDKKKSFILNWSLIIDDQLLSYVVAYCAAYVWVSGTFMWLSLVGVYVFNIN